MKKIESTILIAAIVLAGLVVAAELRAQDSPAALDQRWHDAGTTARGSMWDSSVSLIQSVAPHPGFWHCGTAGNFRYCPCYPPPYTNWVDPETANVGYFRYDFTPLIWSLSVACGAVPEPCLDGQGGPNHTQQAVGGGYTIPIQPQPDVDNYYPTPELATGLGAIWAMFNSAPFPGTNYPQHMKSNPVWVVAYNYKKPAMDADPGCQGGAVTPTPSKTPTPGVTPTPAPSIYADWIYEAVHEGYLVGCDATHFCPGDPSVMWQGLVTRAQQTVFLLKGVHGASYVPPKCHAPGQFVDVVCQ